MIWPVLPLALLRRKDIRASIRVKKKPSEKKFIVAAAVVFVSEESS